MLSTILIHFVAGVVAGSIFAVRTLILLVAIATAGCIGLLLARGAEAALWGIVGLVMLQVGYVCGIAARGMLEVWGVARPVARTSKAP